MPINDFYLAPLQEEHVQLLRDWRNEESNRKWLQYQEIISESEQLRWFRSLDPKNFKLFIIFHQEKPIGEIHLKNIDLELRSAESGIMMDPLAKGTGMAFSASLLLLDYAFEQLELDQLLAKVNRENNEVKKYNEFLGFERIELRPDGFDYYRLDKSKYPEIRKRLTQFLPI
jgi:RimJ/RimL family protein N-acetyltransferase